MKPLFTVHAGEYLLGSHIEHLRPKVNVWVPSKDTGIDLLVSDHDNRRTVSLQAKFSKDYLFTQMEPEFRKPLRACGWWIINRDKLRASRANFWVFVLHGFKGHTFDFVVVPRQELRKRLRSIHGPGTKMIQVFLWVTEGKKCWETRGLERGKADKRRIVEGQYQNQDRDFTRWLNNWKPIKKQLKL